MSITSINFKHPFWTAGTGSRLIFKLDPPHSDIYSMTITVYTISEPYTYKISISQKNELPNSVYFRKKDTIKFINKEWMEYYGDRTVIEYIEHEIIDLENMEKSRIFVDSCPSSPSPRSIRKKIIIKSISGETSKDRHSPREWIKEKITLPLRQSLSGSSSGNSSSESSPRSPEITQGKSPRTYNLLKKVSDKLHQ